MASPTATAVPARESEDKDYLALSLVRGDPYFRMQRAVGLIPPGGLGVARRAIFLALFTWLPIGVWAALRNRIVGGDVEPLLKHFGIQVRCLVAIPLFIVAEGLAHDVISRLVPYFVTSGVVPPKAEPDFRRLVERIARFRDQTLSIVLIAGVVLAVTVLTPKNTHVLEWAWPTAEQPGALGFGGVWFFYVGRPIFMALTLAWLWRLVLLFLLLRGIARLPLAILPSHTDRHGGLGFLERIPIVFAPVLFALSAVFASFAAHQEMYHGAQLKDFQGPMIAILVIATLIFLLPLLVFVRPLAQAKRRAELTYGVLVGRYGRLVQRRWVEGEAVPDDPVSSAPELGPLTDTLSIDEAVRAMRVMPIGKLALASVVIPTAVPLLVVVLLEIPLKELLLTILKALM
jgi:hypothetical protein